MRILFNHHKLWNSVNYEAVGSDINNDLKLRQVRLGWYFVSCCQPEDSEDDRNERKLVEERDKDIKEQLEVGESFRENIKFGQESSHNVLRDFDSEMSEVVVDKGFCGVF